MAVWNVSRIGFALQTPGGEIDSPGSGNRKDEAMTLQILPNGATNPPPVGHLEDGWLDVDNLVATDPVFLEEARSLETELDIGLLCQEAFTLGIAVRRYASPRAEMISLEDQIARFQEDVSRATGEAIAGVSTEISRLVEPDSGVISETVSREMARLESAIALAFNEDDKKSALSRIEGVVSQITKEMVDETSRSVSALLDPGSDTSPLGKLRGGIVREIAGSMQSFATSLGQVHAWLEQQGAVAAERQKGTAKGRTFEEAVGAVLGDIVASIGDEIQSTGEDTGVVEGSKVGDFVTTINAGGHMPFRMVFECKDRKLSHRKTVEELDAAVENRDARVGLMVFSAQGNAPVGSPLVRLAPGRYSVVYDADSTDPIALRVAYQLARTDVIHMARDESAGGIDPQFIHQKVHEARAMLDQVTQVKSGLSKARNGLDRAESVVVSMRTNLMLILDEIEELARRGEEGPA